MVKTAFINFLLVFVSCASAQQTLNKDSLNAEINTLKDLRDQLQNRVPLLQRAINSTDSLFKSVQSKDKEIDSILSAFGRTDGKLKESYHSLDTVRKKTREQKKLLKDIKNTIANNVKAHQELKEKTAQLREELIKIAVHGEQARVDLAKAKELIAELEQQINQLTNLLQ